MVKRRKTSLFKGYKEAVEHGGEHLFDGVVTNGDSVNDGAREPAESTESESPPLAAVPGNATPNAQRKPSWQNRSTFRAPNPYIGTTEVRANQGVDTTEVVPMKYDKNTEVVPMSLPRESIGPTNLSEEGRGTEVLHRSVTLSPSQYKLYIFLFENKNRGTWVKKNLPFKITDKTLYKAVKKLADAKIIIDKYDETTRTHEYAFDPNIQVRCPQGTEVPTPPLPNQGVGTTSPPIINSSSLIKTTTETQFDDPAIEKELQHPEMEYWRGKGTTTRQIMTGIESTGVSLDVFIKSMKHYAHEQPKSEKPPMAHLIGGIKKFGIWAAKPDYKSHEARQAEVEEQVAKDLTAELERLRSAREKRQTAERELAFEKFLSDTSTPEYQKLYASLNKTDRKRMDGGKPFALRMAWLKQMGYEDEV